MVTLTGVRPAARVSTSAEHAAPRSDDLSDNAHRQLIGYIGLFLPILLIFLAVARDGVTRWRGLESISAYYYTGAVAAFVGMLVALALFLFTYRGYDNAYNWADQLAAKSAAVAALVVAFYPTTAPRDLLPLTWWTPRTGGLHHAAAIVLFVLFAVFALWLFRLTAPGETEAADKLWRNRVYMLCGLAIVACILWAGYEGMNSKPIFIPESIALVAFSVSWLVKGYAHRTIVSAARSLLRLKT